MKLSEAINDYINKQAPYVKERTVYSYRSKIPSIIREFGDNDIESYTQEVLQEYIDRNQKLDKSINTIKGLLVLVLLALKPYKAFLPFKYKKVAKKEKEIYTDEEIKEIKDYIKKTNKPYHIAIFIAIETGMRISEITGLKWEDVDFNSKEIRVERNATKNGSLVFISDPKTTAGKRAIPMSNDLYDFLKKNYSPSIEKQTYVLTNTYEIHNLRPIQRSNENLCKKLGIKSHGMHAYRHTFATKLLEKSTDFKSVQQIMGHSNISITQNIYNHSTSERKRNIIDSAFNEQQQPEVFVDETPQLQKTQYITQPDTSEIMEEVQSLKETVYLLCKRVLAIENEKKKLETKIMPNRNGYNEYKEWEDSAGIKTTEYTSIKKLLRLDG